MDEHSIDDTIADETQILEVDTSGFDTVLLDSEEIATAVLEEDTDETALLSEAAAEPGAVVPAGAKHAAAQTSKIKGIAGLKSGKKAKNAKRAKAEESRLKKNGKPKKKHPILKKVLIGVVGLCVVCVVGVGALCVKWLQDLPEYKDVSVYNTVNPTMVYASDHETLLARFQFEYRIPLSSLDEVSTYAAKGTVDTEDMRFYKHFGVDPIGIIRAAVNNLTGGAQQGGSTITQQLVRNTVLADEMDELTLKRKVREAWVSVKLERLMDKDEILLLYLNTINYGQGAYGIEAASQRYFSKNAKDLTIEEAALLVGIPQAPTYNNPIDNPDNAKVRRDHVLDRMADCGTITKDEAEKAKATPIDLKVHWDSNDGIVAYPYFTSYVRDQLTSAYNLSTADVFKGGMVVYTTLDVDMQKKAEAAARKREETLPDNLSVAMTCVDPSTGYVKAMVGGKNYRKNQWNLAAQSQRQAGSSFKMFTLVAALENGISPQTPVNCGSSVKIKDWKVSNIYGIDYSTRSIARAFAVSSNTGFARLICAVGPEKVVDVAHRMGITSDLEAVPSLTLGTSGVTTLEMASAYGTLVTQGVHYDATVVEQVLDPKGEVLIDNTKPEGKQAISKEVAHAAIEVAKLVVNSGEGTGTGAQLKSGQVVAGKTGTSENYMDSWFVGITPQYSTAIWIGDPQNKVPVPTNIYACDMYPSFMNAVMKGKKTKDFFTADDPEYTKKFSNADLDLDVDDSSEKEAKKKKEEAAKKKQAEAAAQAAAEEAEKAAQEEAKAAEEAQRLAEEEAARQAEEEAARQAEEAAQQEEGGGDSGEGESGEGGEGGTE